MNCRDFRRHHDAYIDDTLSGVLIDDMVLHLRFCDVCSRLDTRVRRALLIARNLPTIQPSAHFAARLETRLREERAVAHLQIERRTPGVFAGLSATTYTAIAAGLVLAAGIGGFTSLSAHRAQAVRAAKVIAAHVKSPQHNALKIPIAVAVMPTGMPIWPAVYAAQEAPWQFANDVSSR